jgi:hypothetical protein
VLHAPVASGELPGGEGQQTKCGHADAGQALRSHGAEHPLSRQVRHDHVHGHYQEELVPEEETMNPMWSIQDGPYKCYS